MHVLLSHRIWFLPFLVWCGLITAPSLVRTAAGQTFDLRGDDLRITGTADWAGSGWGGYQPIRMVVANGGGARDLELRIVPREDGRLPTVTRDLRIDKEASARVVMLVPVMSGYHTMRLDVLVEGEAVGLTSELHLIGRPTGPPPSLSLLYISADLLDPRSFETGANSVGPQWLDAFPDRHDYLQFNRGRFGEERPRAESVTAEMLPTSWLGYSATDLVAIELATLRQLRPLERGALIDWVATGGRLIIHGAGAFTEEGSDFQASREEWGWNLPRADWAGPDPAHRHLEMTASDALFSRVGPPNEGSPLSQLLNSSDGSLRRDPRFAPVRVTASWPLEPRPFAVAPHVFGRVAVVSADLADANPADWHWLLTELGGPAITWPMRHGLDSGAGDMEFINLPIPGVRGVPTIAFLVLISLFAILIGPVNYILLWRKGQLSRLVFTVPLLAVVTSLMLFAYGTLSHGFGTKGRVRSVTWIDPAANTATSISRMSLFSGLAPSRGPRFSHETAVYPLMPIGEEFSGGEIDWTNGQSLTEGWLPTRTRTQFVTVNHRDDRERLRVTQTESGLVVVNGFTVALEHLVVNDSRGRPYYCHDLPAGGKKRLTPRTDEQHAAMREVAMERIPEPPDGVEPRELTASLDPSFRQKHAFQWHPQMRQGLLERYLGLIGGAVGSSVGRDDGSGGEADAPDTPNRVLVALRRDTINPLEQPRGFLAIAAENPGIDLGGLIVDERESLHMLTGFW